MPATRVWFIDTSVFLELLAVPGHSQQHEEIRQEFSDRSYRGDKMVLPVTTIIETGNHIAQVKGGRRGAARRFVAALEQARSADPPWVVGDVRWNDPQMEQLLDGDSTGADLLELLAAGRMGTGDVAILVERNDYVATTSFTDVRIWTLDAELSAYEFARG